MDLSVYHGGPSEEIIAAIHAHTAVGRITGDRFYRISPSGEWLPLKDTVDFAILNQVIDTYRS